MKDICISAARQRTCAIAIACLLGGGPVFSEEPTLALFNQVCLETAGQLDRIFARMDELEGWESVPPADQQVLRSLENNCTWHLNGDIELGIVVAGKLRFPKANNPRACMVAIPKRGLTMQDALLFLVGKGGQRAESIYGNSHPYSFTAHLLEGNWVMVGINELADHLQLMLNDPPDDEVQAAISAAEVDSGRP